MTTSTQEQTGLARSDAKTPAVIRTPDEYTRCLSRWLGHYNVLTPFSNISGIAASFGLTATIVKLSADKADGEVYDGLPFLKKDEVALAKVGLRKLAECGGISTSTTRTDPRTIPHYWEFKAIATYRGLDGSTITREATFEWDLRDGSDRLKGWTPNQISEGRKNGLRSCEARAINAAIRECGCGIKQKYTRAELEKPFLVVRVAFQPDMADPEIKRMVTQQALGGVNAMYPPAAPQLGAGAPMADDDRDEPRSVGRGSTQPSASAPAAASTAAATTPAVTADEPPTGDAVRIMKIETKSGVNPKSNKSWTRFIIVDSRGLEHSTFSAALHAAAEKFRDEKTWVEIVEETDGQYRNLVEIIRAGSEPPLPGIGDL